MAENSKIECNICKSREAMLRIMQIIDDLPELDIAHYDAEITAVYNAADEAKDTLICYCDIYAQEPTP